MTREMFETTIPYGEPELMRASDYSRYLSGLAPTAADGTTVDARISTLSGSLRDDLMRFPQAGSAFEAVEVLAACVRHGERVTVHLQCGRHVVPLTVFAPEHLVHCPIDMTEMVERHLPTLGVMHVEPAVLRPPGDPQTGLVGELQAHHPLSPLLWELALRGARRTLLPEITGAAVYRVAPSLDLDALRTSGALHAAVRRLQEATYSLRELADFPGMDRERASRLLNAVYLLAGLIVSRSHPNGLSERWRRR